MSKTATATREPAFTMTALDRCDRCGAQAYAKVAFAPLATNRSAGTLFFCAHHFRAHEPVLRVQAIDVQDETSRLHSST